MHLARFPEHERQEIVALANRTGEAFKAWRDVSPSEREQLARYPTLLKAFYPEASADGWLSRAQIFERVNAATGISRSAYFHRLRAAGIPGRTLYPPAEIESITRLMAEPVESRAKWKDYKPAVSLISQTAKAHTAPEDWRVPGLPEPLFAIAAFLEQQPSRAASTDAIAKNDKNGKHPSYYADVKRYRRWGDWIRRWLIPGVRVWRLAN